MEDKKKKKTTKNTQTQKGQKGGHASSTRGDMPKKDNTLEYIEVEEFTLDDVPGSENK